jgi:hypothetical protein
MARFSLIRNLGCQPWSTKIFYNLFNFSIIVPKIVPTWYRPGTDNWINKLPFPTPTISFNFIEIQSKHDLSHKSSEFYIAFRNIVLLFFQKVRLGVRVQT